MFERFTESARRTLFFSRYEASEFGSLSIETEHMLMGVMREARGVVSRIFPDGAIHAIRSDIRRRVNERIRENVATSMEIPFSAETKRVLQYAADEADGLKHDYIGSEHILLGLLREDDTIAGSVLKDRGFRLPTVRADMLRLLEEWTAPDTGRDEIHDRIERIKALVRRLDVEGDTTENRHRLVEQIVAALDELG